MRAGVPERVAMQMTGHKTRAVFKRYNIVSAGDLREAAQRLDRFAAGPASSPVASRHWSSLVQTSVAVQSFSISGTGS